MSRKAGTPNKTSLRKERWIASQGITPLEVMLKTMRLHYDLAVTELAKGTKADPTIAHAELALAHAAAKDAAPYSHPRLATIQTSAHITGTVSLMDVVRASLQAANANAIETAVNLIEGEIVEKTDVAAE